MNILSKDSSGRYRKAPEDKTIHEANLVAKRCVLRNGRDSVLVEATSAVSAFDKGDANGLGASSFAFFHAVEVFKQ